METAIYYVLSALAVLITLTVHEYCHGYAAYKLGDPTARNLGRLTLNPLKHLDPIGAVCMILFHFGWAKPVPINLRNFKRPRRDFAITALAGPTSNLIMGTVSAFLYLLVLRIFRGIPISSEFQLALMQNTVDFIYIFHVVNIGIAIFNLIPVPPLDGSRLLNVLLPPKLYYSVMRHERTIYFVLIGWLLLGDFAAAALLSAPPLAASPVIRVIASILDLSGLIGYAIGWISDLLIKLFSLIPFLT